MALYGPQGDAEGLDSQRTINYSLFCDRCGFNLRYGRYIGRCNECGNPYNARPLKMEGVFNPHAHRVPTADIFLTLICLGAAFVLVRENINPPVVGNLIWGGIVLVTGLLHAGLSAKRLTHFVRFHRILRRIKHEEED